MHSIIQIVVCTRFAKWLEKQCIHSIMKRNYVLNFVLLLCMSIIDLKCLKFIVNSVLHIVHISERFARCPAQGGG